MSLFTRQLIFISAIFLVSCGLNRSDNQKASTLEGVYIRYDQYEDYKSANVDDFEEGGFSLLRFYRDGVVLSVSQRGTDPIKDWPKIKEWFNRKQESPPHSVGRYDIKGASITMSLESSFGQVTLESNYGQVTYDGTVKDDTLTLNMHSLINGNRLENLDFYKTDLE